MTQQHSQTFSKQEYSQLHALFSEISNYIEEQDPEVYEQIDLSKYENLGVRPTSIHKNKSEHKEALQELSTSIVEACQELEP